MIEAATPESKGGTPPASSSATPATETKKAPEQGNNEQGNAVPEQVTLDKEVHDKLVKDAADLPRANARQAASDRKVTRLERLMGKGKGTHFKPESGATPSQEDVEAQKEEDALAEDRKASQGIMAVAIDPAYREVLDADPTLRNLLTSNPLGVLPLLAPDAVDAEDAIGLVKEALQTRADEITAKVKADKEGEGEEGDKKPDVAQTETPGTGANIPGAQQDNVDTEAARKLPNTEDAISGMVKAGIGKMGKE